MAKDTDLVDSQLQHPSVHHHFAIHSDQGTQRYIRNRLTIVPPHADNGSSAIINCTGIGRDTTDTLSLHQHNNGVYVVSLAC